MLPWLLADLFAVAATDSASPLVPVDSVAAHFGAEFDVCTFEDAAKATGLKATILALSGHFFGSWLVGVNLYFFTVLDDIWAAP